MGGDEGMPWYWILIIIAAVVGPFEALYTLNKARRNREERQKRLQQEQEEKKDES